MKNIPDIRFRHYFVLAFVFLILIGLVARLSYLHVFNKSFLNQQSELRAVRNVKLPAYRGVITDRNGEPIAMSTPVVSLWAEPFRLAQAQDSQLHLLAQETGQSFLSIKKQIDNYRDKEFFYIKRHMAPYHAQKIMAEQIPGLNSQQEYKRYYPTGEVFVHVLGFTDLDEKGQEGIEAAFESWLKGTPGRKSVMKDRKGHVIDDITQIKAPSSGQTLVLSLDKRIQYIAYYALKKAVQNSHARSGSLVVVRPKTGEILALVNQPSLNPNNRLGFKPHKYRNRAISDPFEPGSVIKPFAALAYLQSGQIQPDTKVNTSPGKYLLGKETIHDVHDYGTLSLTDIIVKSSNIGMTKLSFKMPPADLIKTYQNFGFGYSTEVGLSAENEGRITLDPDPIKVASLSYGYGLTVTPLQLAQAFSILANRGVKKPLTFFKQQLPPHGDRIFAKDNCDAVIDMMKKTVAMGTGRRAKVSGFAVAGKTGTSRKMSEKGYTQQHHIASFAGIVPADQPQLVVVVVIDDPAGAYYGGLIAAPVFKEVAARSLHILGIAPLLEMTS